MRRRSLVLAGLALILLPLAVFAQGAPPNDVIDATSVDIQNLLKSYAKDRITDQLLRGVDAGKLNVNLAVATRPANPNATDALYHDKVTEVYYVLRGSGTQVTGGTGGAAKTPGGNVLTMVGPSTASATMEGGRSRKLVAGDVIIIPPHTWHQWGAIDAGGVDYLVIRLDPDHVIKK